MDSNLRSLNVELDRLPAHALSLGQSAIFPPESWEADRKARFEIGPSTALFHRSVPSLRQLNWTIEEIGRGRAVTRLPLNVESSNQYITQQAALMLLAADYTGGIALSTLFKDTPVIGFHPQRDHYGAYLWGAGATIKWLQPSTGDLICKSTIPERDWDDIATSFSSGRDVKYKARIKMYNEDSMKIVAVSDFNYWGRNSHSLRATGGALETTHHMLTHKLRTSARLIAALRSWITMEQDNGTPLDPYSSNAAGKQGQAMAKKFSIDSPQLADLVRARTLHCDMELRAFSRIHPKFLVINIGCGYDSRPWRMRDLGGAVFVNLDLPVMIQDRGRVLPPLSESPYTILESAYDILCDDLTTKLHSVQAPSELPAFVIWEGGSMYFTQAEAAAIFIQMRATLPPRSRVWFDCVSSAAVNDMTGLTEVKAFMDSMRMIGEPFVQGYDYQEDMLGHAGMSTVGWIPASEVLESADPVMQHYAFALCEPR